MARIKIKPDNGVVAEDGLLALMRKHGTAVVRDEPASPSYRFALWIDQRSTVQRAIKASLERPTITVDVSGYHYGNAANQYTNSQNQLTVSDRDFERILEIIKTPSEPNAALAQLAEDFYQHFQ